MNKTTVELSKRQYKEIIKTMREGGTGFRPNVRIATALVIEANLGLRIEDILSLKLGDIIADGNRYRFNIVEKKTGKKRVFTVPKTIYKYLQRYADKNGKTQDDILFDVCERQVQQLLKTICDYLGYENIGTRYYDYLEKSGHDCDGIKLSGEIIVETFLKKNSIRFKTQRDTLQCINPDTGYVMPYDFEIIGKRILIEVQGEQHRSFIPRFHVTEEGFEYQKKKDEYKKSFAEGKGYKLIEIWYDELENEAYKNKIIDALQIGKLGA